MAIRETCKTRKWRLWAINVRTNHVHSVVTGTRDPDIVLNAFKANATREMKESVAGKAVTRPGLRMVARGVFGMSTT
ncbi:MAG: hypothetical protein H0U18_14775 [Pyrinomonadaceae bacterium]|nr:hypothetical protein [Pyrinomonadaceae bacterium]